MKNECNRRKHLGFGNYGIILSAVFAAIFLFAVFLSACSGSGSSAPASPVVGMSSSSDVSGEGAGVNWPYDRSWSRLDIGGGFIFRFTGGAQLSGEAIENGDVLIVEINSASEQDISGVQGELFFDSSKFSAKSAEFSGPLEAAEIKLSVTSLQDRAAAGAAFAGLEKRRAKSGETLIRFVLYRGPARNMSQAGSRVPQGPENMPRDLTVNVNEETGMMQLVWRQRLHGDYDQSGEVGVPDITPVALYYLANTGSVLTVVDGDESGEVGISDITPIALNYLKQQTGFNVYLGSRAEASSPYIYVRKGASNPSVSYRPADFPDVLTRYTFNFPISEFGDFNVRIVPVGPDAAEAGSETYAENEYTRAAPVPMQPDNIRITDIRSDSVTVEWDPVTDQYAAEIGCWKSTTGGTDISNYVNDASYADLPFPASHTFSLLEPETTYHFTITVHSSFGLDSVVERTVSGFTVDTPPAPQNMTLLGATRTTATVGWDELTDERIATVIFWKNETGGTDLADYEQVAEISAPPFPAEFTFDTLTPVTQYYFVVTTRSAQGVDCIVPDPVEAFTAVPPVADFTSPAEIFLNDPRPEQGKFDAIQSFDPDNPDELDPKNGIAEYRWNWGDGSPPESTPNPVTYKTNWPDVGEYSVTLTVVDGDGNVSQPFVRGVTVTTGRTDLLIVYNSNPAVVNVSREIADYYADPDTGRGIDPSYIVGFDWDDPAESNMEIVTRNYYDTVIKPDMESYIDGAGIKFSIKYIVLCKGVPLKIRAVSGSNYNDLDYASVDSEFCLLYQNHSLPGRLQNPFYGVFVPDLPFDSFTFMRNGVTLSYLVARLDAYTLDEVKAMIDRAHLAPGNTDGYVLLDDHPTKNYDMMHTPTADGRPSAFTVLTNYGANMLADDTADRLTRTFISNDTISQNVVGWCGHGVHHGGWPSGAQYILNDVDFGYLPGAMFISYESFNGWSFNSPESRNGQALVADFIRMGGSCAIGNVWEPWSDAVGDESIAFVRYLQGDNSIEALYRSLRYVSWVEVVVGDPLMTIVAE